MAVIKCKMCGGSLSLTEDSSVCECEYCGTKQTVPKADDEKKLTLFNRAGKLLRSCEFDKAAGIFESIAEDFPEEAEAYWGLVLCKYGIEYVDDPATGKKIPTCHRSSFESVEDDPNFEQACENADAVARRIYREEAKQIESLRQRILEVSGREEPYDVFISYKETNEEGERTPDSVIAQDIYKALVGEGYRVFFSRISLEGKLGVEYEPYIFAALNSAQVMLVIGTDYENFGAVWVKNEWSRFLKLIASGQPKTLIPVYKDMDPYDMPKELRGLAAQNMGKLGAMQDLLHGVEKLVGKKNEEEQQPGQSQPMIQQFVQGGGPNVTALLKRGTLALEDGNWDGAKTYFDRALDTDPENARAYVGLLLADLHARDGAAIERVSELPVEINANYRKALRFADPKLKKALEGCAGRVREKLQRRLQEHDDELARIRKRNHKAKALISTGVGHTVAVSTSGTVFAVGDTLSGRCDVEEWTDIVAVSAGLNESIGLRADGTVISTQLIAGRNNGQCYVGTWRNITAIACSGRHTVGLRADGTVVATVFLGDQSKNKGQCEVSSWRDIVEIDASLFFTVGLKSDGTVVIAGDKGEGRDKALSWTGIVSVSCGPEHIVGLKADGTVVAAGSNHAGQCMVSSWREIVAVAAGACHTVGLRADGKAVSTPFQDTDHPEDDHGQCNVSSWRNVVAVSGKAYHTVGVLSDGSVVSTEYIGDPIDDFGQRDVSDWKLFHSVDTIEDECRATLERAKAERRDRAAFLNFKKNSLMTELAGLKGLFAVKRRKEIEESLAEIEEELNCEEERRAAAERAEAEHRNRLGFYNSKKASLEAELANLKGLFAIKRRREIEESLAEIEEELKRLG